MRPAERRGRSLPATTESSPSWRSSSTMSGPTSPAGCFKWRSSRTGSPAFPHKLRTDPHAEVIQRLPKTSASSRGFAVLCLRLPPVRERQHLDAASGTGCERGGDRRAAFVPRKLRHDEAEAVENEHGGADLERPLREPLRFLHDAERWRAAPNEQAFPELRMRRGVIPDPPPHRTRPLLRPVGREVQHATIRRCDREAEDPAITDLEQREDKLQPDVACSHFSRWPSFAALPPTNGRRRRPICRATSDADTRAASRRARAAPVTARCRTHDASLTSMPVG